MENSGEGQEARPKLPSGTERVGSPKSLGIIGRIFGRRTEAPTPKPNTTPPSEQPPIEKKGQPPQLNSHEQLREALLKLRIEMKNAFYKSGDYRFWVMPENELGYAEQNLIPNVSAENLDIEGTLRLLQSIMNVKSRFPNIKGMESIGTLEQMARLPQKQPEQSVNLSEPEFTQRKTDLSQRLTTMVNETLQGKGFDPRLRVLPTQNFNTSLQLLNELSPKDISSGKAQARFNTIESHLNNFTNTYSRQ